MTHSRYKRKNKHIPSTTAELGYTVDGIAAISANTHWPKSSPSQREDERATFDFCPRCKETIELYRRENKYNPTKIVKICSKCGMIRNSTLWISLMKEGA